MEVKAEMKEAVERFPFWNPDEMIKQIASPLCQKFQSPVSSALSVIAQGPPSKPGPSKADYSQEGFVIEQFSRKERFENDGTSSREDTARAKIQSEAGVQRYGLLTFSYPSATGTFEIGYVRVRKPDGTVVETPPEGMQDMAAEITRQAPFYSDLHEKHVAVKGLSVGDVVEYRTEEHTTKPLASGQFWTEYTFARDQIVLDEQVEISVPRERAIKMTSATVQPVISEADGRRASTHGTTRTLRTKIRRTKNGRRPSRFGSRLRGGSRGPTC
jgi:hypothetical protein